MSKPKVHNAKYLTYIIVLLILVITAVSYLLYKQYSQNRILAEKDKKLTDQIQMLTNTESIKICVDSDGGKDYYINGQIKFEEQDKNGSLLATSDPSDDCVDRVIAGENRKVLREYYCDPNDQVAYDYFTCSKGCKKGVCVR